MLCQNDTKVSYTAQPYPDSKELQDRDYLIYLKAWERHVTAVEDGSIREEALGGADTTTRSQVVWQVRALGIDEQEEEIGMAGGDAGGYLRLSGTGASSGEGLPTAQGEGA